jgi:anti-sigma28 factor (negative regulator of flagellin synthesis)
MEAGHLAVVLGVRVRGAGSVPGAANGEIRFKLVARLRAEIAAGTYRVGSADVAEKMMAAMMR